MILLISLVDDQQLFRNGLASLIKSIPGFTLVSEAENGQVFIDQLQTAGQLPHIALIDMEMPVMNGVELNAVLQQQYPSIKVIVLSTYNQSALLPK